VRRDAGIRVYGAQEIVRPPAHNADRARRLDPLIDVVVRKSAPLPGPSLSNLVGRLRHGVPQWRRDLKPALQRARLRLSHTEVDGVEWYWPADETIGTGTPSETVYLLGPFGPGGWDRRGLQDFGGG